MFFGQFVELKTEDFIWLLFQSKEKNIKKLQQSLGNKQILPICNLIAPLSLFWILL